MNPKHIKKVQDDRRAVAPYNFVELPDQVVEAQPLPDRNYYCSEKHTGRIECTLTTESPLYIRCGWSPEDFAKYGETLFKDLPFNLQQKRANFFVNPVTNELMIPGSSLRGMLRTLVEIASFGKIDRVSGEKNFFFRAVAADKDDPLKEEYKKYINSPNIKAGYLVQKQGAWFIRPAMLIDDKYSFIWVKEDKVKSISKFILMSNLKDYKPQYFINISFEDIFTKNGCNFARKVSDQCTNYKYQGVLLTSGNMLEGNTNPNDLRRKNHCIVREPNPSDTLLEISEDAIQSYCSALTPFQKKEPFNENKGVLKQGRCIFYCQPESGQTVTLFGQSPNFRIPYFFPGSLKASTARDFIPSYLKNAIDQPIIIDIAEAIFGFVRSDKYAESVQQSCASRVFVSDGVLTPHQEKKVQKSLDNEPQSILLSSPKPTTFQHYLVQTSDEKSKLKHYASQPYNGKTGETLIRGHKLYWHKPYQEIEVPADSETQTSLVKPIDPEIQFTFNIHFENLSAVELGALLWVLNIAQDNDYRLKLGMGKPLGLGAVKIEPTLYLSNRKERYQSLFDGNGFWQIGETEDKDVSSYVSKFESYILEQLNHTGDFKNLCRIKILLAMLSWPGPSDVENTTRYMEIERKKSPKIGKNPNEQNEYKERPVLPNALDVMGDVMGIEVECDRPSPSVFQESTASLSKKSTAPDQPTKKFFEDQEIDAKVVDIEVQKGGKLKTTITYEIQGSDCQAKEEIYKKNISLLIDDIVKVRIVKVQENKIRKVKHID